MSNEDYEVRVTEISHHGIGHQLQWGSSQSSGQMIYHPHANDEEEINRSSKKPKKDDFNQQTTPTKGQNRTFHSPSSSSPESYITQKSGKRKRPNKYAHSVARNLQYVYEDEDDDETAVSPENKLIKHLKKLSEIMEQSLERTGSLVLDLVSDSRFKDACSAVGTGTKQLKEGLKTISKVRELLRELKDEK